MPARDNHAAARALAEWAREGFQTAYVGQIADTYGVAKRTVWRWKDALDDDPELSALFQERLHDILDRDWAEHLDATLAEAIDRIRELLLTEHDLEKVVEAFRALSEVAITREVLRGPADGQTDSGYAETGRASTRGSEALPN